jgi:putative DNA primase/helicase
MVKKTLVAAVRRILEPGTQVDTMLVLKGAGGLFKSRAIRRLFSERFYKDQLPDLKDDARASHSLLGYWGIESGELDKFLRADNTTAKAFLSRSEDCYHAPYGRYDVRRKRQCVFFGTTNDDGFLTDSTGNRRYWIVVVYIEVDLEWVESVRDSVWAAALELAQDPTFKHWFDDAKGEADESREEHEYRDPWHSAIEDYCTGRKEVRWEDVYAKGVAPGETNAIAKASRKEMLRVCAVLRRLKCEQKRAFSENGKRSWIWTVPDALAHATPTQAEIVRRKTEMSVAKLVTLATSVKSN